VSNGIPAKRALIALIAAQPDLEGVTVDYAFKGKNLGREYVYGGRVNAEQTYPNMTSGVKPRDERLTVDVHVYVFIPGGDQVDADTRAMELGGAMETALAADVTLGGTVPGLRWGGVTGYELTPTFDDDGVYSEVVYHVLFSSRLF
jgi:hypothetical protein